MSLLGSENTGRSGLRSQEACPYGLDNPLAVYAEQGPIHLKDCRGGEMADTGDLKISIFRFHWNSSASKKRDKPSKIRFFTEIGRAHV